MATNNNNTDTLPLNKCLTPHQSQQMRHFVLPHSMHSKASSDDEEDPSTFPLQPAHDDDDEEEVFSSFSLLRPSGTLKFVGEDDGDKSYNAEDAEVAASTEPNSSDDEYDVPPAIIQQNKETCKKGTSKKKQPMASKAVCIV